LLNISAHSGRVFGIAFSPDGKQFASCGDDKMIIIWDRATGKKQQTLEGHFGWVHCVAYSPDGSWIASCGADGDIRVWMRQTGKERFRLEGHVGQVNSIAFNHTGLRLVSAGASDRTIKLWELSRGQELLSLDVQGSALGVAFNPDGSLVASATSDTSVQIWGATPGKK
jgi:WD40 repeat protein